MKDHGFTPYKCSQCDSTFSRLQQLKNHKCPSFSGEVPKKCNICLRTLKSFRKDPVMHMFRCKNIKTKLEVQEVNVKQEEDVKREKEVNMHVEEWSHVEPPRYDYRFKLTPVVPLLGRLIS